LESIPCVDPDHEADDEYDFAGENDGVHDLGLSYRRDGDLMTGGSTGALSSALICFARRLRIRRV
jgi:hypothetical protein